MCVPEVIVENTKLREVAVEGRDILASYTAERSDLEDITFISIYKEG